MAAFYFKQTKRTGERAYEFTHKTFGEYLAACRLVDAIAETEQERADKGSRRRPWDEEAALVGWTRLSGPAAIDWDLQRFILRQIEVTKEDDGPEVVGGWQQTTAELLSYELAHSLPMHLLGLSTFKEMTRQARNAEQALVVAHFCCASTTGELSPIQWPDQFALRDLVARLNQGNYWSLVQKSLGWLGSHEERGNHWLYWADLDLQNFEGANLQGAILTGSNLEGANLGRSNLEGANLGRANLVGANLERANLEEASLKGSNLEGANLERANLGGASLLVANLERANLKRANLEGANLEGANLKGVKRLDAAQGLDKVASWRGAIMERKWVERLGLDAEKLGLEVVDDLDEEEPANPTSPQV